MKFRLPSSVFRLPSSVFRLPSSVFRRSALRRAALLIGRVGDRGDFHLGRGEGRAARSCGTLYEIALA
ncbi:MAG: hypothetical protein FLDDKLPJ_01481 [Phycisphaerae bacterium]|nr:hypothetical protein [Phycisphaerae bacterium]